MEQFEPVLSVDPATGLQRYLFRYSCVNLNELAFALSSVKARGK